MSKFLVVLAGTVAGLYLLSKSNDKYLPASPASGIPSDGTVLEGRNE